MVVTDESMMWHYDNEEHVLTLYIETLMAEVAGIFRYEIPFSFINFQHNSILIPALLNKVLLNKQYFYTRDKTIGESIEIKVIKIVHLKDYEYNDGNNTVDSSYYLKVVPEASDMLKEFCSWKNRNRHHIHNLTNVNILFSDNGE